MHISEGKGWKQRPDEEGIATLHCGHIIFAIYLLETET